MKIETHLKYGDGDEPWKPNLLTAILQIILAPVVLLLSWLIMALVVVLDLASVGSLHIVLKATPKKILMPDGTVRDPQASHN